MLRSLKDMIGYQVVCPEGILGDVEDFYFDNKKWVIRYVVMKLSSIVDGKKVLLTPGMFVDEPDWDSRTFAVEISRETAMHSPGIDTEQPVIRKMEKAINDYFSQPYYWATSTYPGAAMPGIVSERDIKLEPDPSPDEAEKESHLHSLKDMLKYSVLARDSSNGVLDDIITNDANWHIDSLVTSGKGFFGGEQYMIKPGKVERIDHKGEMILLAMTSQQIKEGPRYNPEEPVNVKIEEHRYDYRGKPKDWKDTDDIDQ